MGEQTRERSFDELAKGLASGTLSRGKALRLMGAALLGGALASLPGGAWASHKGTPHGGRWGRRQRRRGRKEFVRQVLQDPLRRGHSRPGGVR